MKTHPFRNEGGWKLTDLLFWALALGALAWAVKGFLDHPEWRNAKPAEHSAYEDTK